MLLSNNSARDDKLTLEEIPPMYYINSNVQPHMYNKKLLGNGSSQIETSGRKLMCAICGAYDDIQIFTENIFIIFRNLILTISKVAYTKEVCSLSTDLH